MSRILIVHPDLRPPGRGNAVAAWTIQALAKRHELTVLGFRPPDLAAVNRFYGTAIGENDARWELVPGPTRLVWNVLRRLPMPLAVLKRQLLARAARRLSARFDLALSTDGEMDLGGRGLQYVHTVWPARRKGLLTRLVHLPIDLYFRLCFALSHRDEAAVRRNVTLASSDSTARQLAAVNGVNAQALYPPLVASPGIPWEQRENGFVALGRFSDKRLEEALDILDEVHAHALSPSLHVVGHRGSGSGRLLRRCEERSWVTVHEDMPRADVLALLGTTRYGFSDLAACNEMVAAGCIPFVPESSAKAEIVDQPSLRYRDKAEAVSRICAVMGYPANQRSLLSHLASGARRFSAVRFTEEVGTLVDDMLATARLIKVVKERPLTPTELILPS